MNPGLMNAGIRPSSAIDQSSCRGSAAHGGDFASPLPRQTVSYHQLEHSQSYTPASWFSSSSVVQMPPVQQGPPLPQAFAVYPPASESSPMFGQYSPQVTPPTNYAASQPQYSPAVPPPHQQLFVVANAQLVPGAAVPQAPPIAQFTPTGQPPPYPVGFVPAGQPIANQGQAVPEQAVSSAAAGYVVATPTQQYVVANPQPVVMQPAPVNQSFVASQYVKTSPLPPQQFVMMPAGQYIVPPPAPAPAPPQAGPQVYSVVANQNVSLRPSEPPPCIVQPVLPSQRMPLPVAAVPNQFQPIAVPAQVMPANQIQPMLQMVPPTAVVSTNQPPPTAPANGVQSLATSQLSVPAQPVYCYVPSGTVPWPVARGGPVNELQAQCMPLNSALSTSVQQQTLPASANIQVHISLSLSNKCYVVITLCQWVSSRQSCDCSWYAGLPTIFSIHCQTGHILLLNRSKKCQISQSR